MPESRKNGANISVYHAPLPGATSTTVISSSMPKNIRVSTGCRSSFLARFFSGRLSEFAYWLNFALVVFSAPLVASLAITADMLVVAKKTAVRIPVKVTLLILLLSMLLTPH